MHADIECACVWYTHVFVSHLDSHRPDEGGLASLTQLLDVNLVEIIFLAINCLRTKKRQHVYLDTVQWEVQ